VTAAAKELLSAAVVAAVDVYWLPLGAGGRSVRWNGRVYEALVAARARRPRQDLYHSALVVHVPAGRFVIEMTPIPDGNGARRGVVGEGPVGTRWAGRLRLFRYEIRRWRDGVIPDVAEAVDSPRRLSCDDLDTAQRLLDLVDLLPRPTWGRDEFGLGEMWNSNSVVAWLLERSGVGTASAAPPAGGRAPGWTAGRCAARRDQGGGRSNAAPPVDVRPNIIAGPFTPSQRQGSEVSRSPRSSW
jgi:hypothetical protein